MGCSFPDIITMCITKLAMHNNKKDRWDRGKPDPLTNTLLSHQGYHTNTAEVNV